MQHIGLTNVNLQHIHAFLVVAKYMNMTKAAEAIHVTQSLLSQKIAALEQDIDLQLFTRSKRRLKLTPAGEYLYQHLSDVVSTLDQHIEAARKEQQRAEKHINITFCYGISTSHTTQIMNCLREAFPSLSFSFQLMEIFQMPEELMEFRTDVFIAPNYDLDRFDGLIQHTTITNSKIKVVVGKNHPLASRTQIEWADLKDRNILCQPASQSGGYERCISCICQNHGFVPNLVPCNNIFTTTARMVLGEGILVGVLSPTEGLTDECIEFEMPEPTIPIVMSYIDRGNDLLTNFIECSKDYLIKFF